MSRKPEWPKSGNLGPLPHKRLTPYIHQYTPGFPKRKWQLCLEKTGVHKCHMAELGHIPTYFQLWSLLCPSATLWHECKKLSRIQKIQKPKGMDLSCQQQVEGKTQHNKASQSESASCYFNKWNQSYRNSRKQKLLKLSHKTLGYVLKAAIWYS